MAKLTPTLKLLRTGDPQSAFHHQSPHEILNTFGAPTYLLGTSSKLIKCNNVGVLARVLYLTPGIYCPAASASCLAACLGHTSGKMRFPSSVTARDKRAALYAANREAFISQLKAELHKLELDAKRNDCLPAVRLNGTSDLAWERRHPELFAEFPDIQFYDYTKITGRMYRFLDESQSSSRRSWPKNYHLTFSAEQAGEAISTEILKGGGTVALCFWPKLPETWWEYPVINGDQHDARFVDPPGNIVGLLAKGLARVDTSGFTIRPCPKCSSERRELTRVYLAEDTHRTTHHRCLDCGHEVQERLKLAG